jgi:molybdate transport system substrate-binding protein
MLSEAKHLLFLPWNIKQTLRSAQGDKVVLNPEWRCFSSLLLTLLCVLFLMGLGTNAVFADDEPLLIFAAASLGGPLDTLASRYMANTGTPILIAYGASGSLAQQIRIGADVDLFISADTSWIMRLAEDKNSPILRWEPFLRNHLVLITSSDLDFRTRAFGPLDGPTVGRIAIADPESAPAGRYARAYLQQIGIYDRIRAKLITQEDVRGVINAVRLGVADAGFAYASDVNVTGKVRVVEIIPDSLHPPIVYGLATMKGGRAAQAAKFIEFLHSPDAVALFTKAGFLIDSPIGRNP